MCITLFTITHKNPKLAQEIKVFKKRRFQLTIAISGMLCLSAFLIIHIYKDLSTPTTAWYFHSTLIWIVVMTLASILFLYKWNLLKNKVPDISKHFINLPEE